MGNLYDVTDLVFGIVEITYTVYYLLMIIDSSKQMKKSTC